MRNEPLNACALASCKTPGSMMMMMMRRRSKPGEGDVGGSEMGVWWWCKCSLCRNDDWQHLLHLMQKLESLPNFSSVIRTKNCFSYSPMFSRKAKEHHGIPIHL